MEERLKRVLASVFEVPESSIDDSANPDVVEGWDSLNHMKLVVALEDEFGIKFSDEEILEMQSFKLIKYTISQYLAKD